MISRVRTNYEDIAQRKGHRVAELYVRQARTSKRTACDSSTSPRASADSLRVLRASADCPRESQSNSWSLLSGSRNRDSVSAPSRTISTLRTRICKYLPSKGASRSLQYKSLNSNHVLVLFRASLPQCLGAPPKSIHGSSKKDHEDESILSMPEPSGKRPAARCSTRKLGEEIFSPSHEFPNTSLVFCF